MCLDGDRTHLYIFRALLAWLDGKSSTTRTAVGVHDGMDDRVDVGAGDQSIMLWLGDESEDAMPLTHSMSTRLGKTLPMDARKVISCGCGFTA